MNLSNRGPLGLRAPKAAQDLAYLARVRGLPCCICEAFGEHQRTPTQAHHVCHGRFSSRKTPDRMAIPLCDGHHQGEFDTTKLAIHQEKAAWLEAYGPDYEWTPQTQDRLGV